MADAADPGLHKLLLEHHLGSDKIAEILDHHHIGSIETRIPVTATFDPVGSTATLIAERFASSEIDPMDSTAVMLICAILSDTVLLNSPTTTDRDRNAIDLLEDLILEGSSGVIGALPMNWTVWGRTRAHAARTAYFAGLVPAGAVVVSNVGRITAASLAGKDAERQVELLQAAVLRALCQSMMLDADGVEVNVPLTAIGLDSIVALELKDRIESAIDVTVRTSALIGGTPADNRAGIMISPPPPAMASIKPVRTAVAVRAT